MQVRVFVLALAATSLGLVAATDAPCQYEKMLLKKAQERCLGTPCFRSLFPRPKQIQQKVQKEESHKPKGVLGMADTLAHVVGKFVPAMKPFLMVMDGIKLVAKFFHTSYDVDTEDYWQDLVDTVAAFVAESIDDSIIEQTNSAVDRLSEDLQLYIDVSNTTRSFSALQLTMKMDTELENILSTYSGMVHKERGVLHYLDMATTRLVLWQTTAFRYIADYTVHGQLPTGEDVCDIVYKWSLVYNTETKHIMEEQMAALASWTNEYTNKLRISCNMHCDDPVFGSWDKTTTCKVIDGYHADLELSNTENFCEKRHCPSCDMQCFNSCPPDLMKPFIEDTQDSYREMVVHTMELLGNLFAMQIKYLDEYKEDCGIPS